VFDALPNEACRGVAEPHPLNFPRSYLRRRARAIQASA